MLNRKAFVLLFIGVCVSALLISNVAGGKSDSEIKSLKFKSFTRTFSNDSIIANMDSRPLRRAHSTKETKTRKSKDESGHKKSRSRDPSKHPPRRTQIDTSMMASTASQSSKDVSKYPPRRTQIDSSMMKSSAGQSSKDVSKYPPRTSQIDSSMMTSTARRSSRGGSSRYPSDGSSLVDSMGSLRISSDGSSHRSSRRSSRAPPPPGVIENIRGRAADAAAQGWGAVRNGIGEITRDITPQEIDQRHAFNFPKEGRGAYNYFFGEADYYTGNFAQQGPVKNPYDFYEGTGYVEGSGGGQYIKDYEQRTGGGNHHSD